MTVIANLSNYIIVVQYNLYSLCCALDFYCSYIIHCKFVPLSPINLRLRFAYKVYVKVYVSITYITYK